MKLRRETLILIGLGVGLVLLIIAGLQLNSNGPQGRPSTHTSDPRGALALYRWIAGMGYNVERLQYRTFALDPTTNLLFILAPSVRISAEEADLLVAWVEEGGTLVLADERTGDFAPLGALFRALDLGLVRPDEGAGFAAVPVLQPALAAPPAARLNIRSGARVETTRNDLAILAGDAAGPTLVGLQLGEGYVYLSSSVFPFTNSGLGADDNAALTLNLLRRVPAGGRIAFDEIHHGFIREPSLRDLILGSPWGWAILYALVVLGAFVVAGGRRFGKPVPLREETARRSSAEYLESMAGLLRRGRKADYVLEHYRSDLKRRLARPYGLSPQLADAEFVRELTLAQPDLDAERLRSLLARMARTGVSDDELLRLVAEADRL
jgi:hypothetical protein